ncbi:MAG: nidogen-like domain-containing protein [Polyangiales bacterium]
MLDPTTTAPRVDPDHHGFGTRSGLLLRNAFHTAMFVNSSRNITFRGAVGSFTPTPFPIAAQPMIAPYWGDVDTRGVVSMPAGANATYYDVRPGRVTVTWYLVGYYASHVDKLNNFQLILEDRSAERVAGDFDVEFRYDRCEWTTGDASGGSMGLGGTPAQAGFDAGDTMNSTTLPGSRTMAVLNLCTTTNVTGGAPGLWRFQIRSGGVSQCGNAVREAGEECDDGNTTPGDGCSSSCRTELANGAMCMAGDQCRSGFCTDGVCCGSRCDGQCETCSATGTAGTCTAVTGAPTGGRMACAGAGSTCGGTCNGTNRAACTYPGSSTQCGAGSCTAGSATAASTCNGSGMCAAGATAACAPYVCGMTACRTDCATDMDCAAGNYCNAMNRCVPRQAPGATCTTTSSCLSGNCVDGVCCDTACNGQCEACNVTGSVGTCTAVTGAPVGARTACAGAGSTCGGTCDGTNRTACAYPGTMTACREASCAMGTATLGATCDGAGACPEESTAPCAPYACGATACLTSCKSNDGCAMGSACIGGTCQGRRPNGGMCTDANECESGNCVDGVCCNTACNGQCEACDVSGSLGTCTPATGAPHGTRTACTGTGDCAGACDGMNTAACTFPGASTTCGMASCAAGVATAAPTCDGMGACGMAMTTNCGPYTCGDTGCRTMCSQASDCAEGYTCENAACVMIVADAGTDAAVEDVVDASADVVTDAGMKTPDVVTQDVVTEDVPSIDAGNTVTGDIRGDGCACSTPGTSRSSSGRGALAVMLLAGLSLLRVRRRR